MSSVATVLFNVTELKRARDSLRAKERMLAEIFRSCPECITLTTLDGGIFAEVNEAAARLFGYSRDEMTGRGAVELGLWCSTRERDEVVGRLKSEGRIQNFETRVRRKDGEAVDILMSMAPLEVEGRDCIITFAMDIGDRKRMEAALSESLREKETFLRELRHRIKNGLALIEGLVGLEAGRAEDKRTAEVLDNLKSRIASMSVLYELFLSSGFEDSIDLAEYLGSVLDSLAEAYLRADGGIRVERRLETVRIDAKSAQSWGFIVNELVTNALKYAFRRTSGGLIRVDLSSTDGWIELVVSDDGDGLPADFDVESSGGLGLDIVRMMAAQLKGALVVEGGRGTVFIVRAPVRAESSA